MVLSNTVCLKVADLKGRKVENVCGRIFWIAHFFESTAQHFLSKKYIRNVSVKLKRKIDTFSFVQSIGGAPRLTRPLWSLLELKILVFKKF